jgi:hypothetical protein
LLERLADLMVEGLGEEVSFLVDPVIKMCTWSPIEEMITECEYKRMSRSRRAQDIIT